MADRVQIILEAEDFTSGVVRGIVSQFGKLGDTLSDSATAFSKWNDLVEINKKALAGDEQAIADLESAYSEAGVAIARLGETLAVLAIETLKEAVQVTAEYNAEIRDLALISGTGAQEASRFLQVLDDYELTAEDAMTASRALKEKGLTPTIETLAQLADEYKKISDPAKKLEFIQDNLGRSGTKWALILNQQSDALLEAAESANKFLVKTDEQIAKSEIQRLALDNLGDSWKGIQNAIGDTWGELVVANEASQRAIEILKEQGVSIDSNTIRTDEYRIALQQAKEEQLQSALASLEQAQANEDLTISIEEELRALEELSKENQEFLGLIDTLTGNLVSYKQKHADIQQQLDEGKITQEEAGLAWQRLADEQELATNRMILSMLNQQLAVDGLSAKETEYLLDLGLKWGVYSEEAVAQAKEAQLELANLVAQFNAVPENRTMTMTVNTIYNGSLPSSYYQSERGGRAGGGSVSSGGMYQVNERNTPELLSFGGKQYLMMPQSGGGNVIPMSTQGGGGNSSTQTPSNTELNINYKKMGRALRDAMRAEVN